MPSKRRIGVYFFILLTCALAGCERASEQPSTDTGTQTPPQTSIAIPQPDYVGKQACSECHSEQLNDWQGSHHDLAMQLATPETVLANFDNTEFTYHGVKSIFRREGDQFKVKTDGPDGKLKDYTIKYTFGAIPLQQYLIEFDDGRVQALGIAWDSRSKVQGGQRWFHLYPDQKVDHQHELHWTRRQQNWNFMCAECHSANLKKNYDSTTDRFNTSFSEINVACEACHGPGSNHVAWAKGEQPWPKLKDKGNGLIVQFDERKDVQWIIDAQTGNAQRSTKRSSSKEINVCAQCHSRRSQLSEDFIHGQAIGNTHRIALLDEHLYFSDGQPNDETYVYGSFLQSKMYHQGVTCSDCHEPHSLKLHAPGDQVCFQCHQANKYTSTQHHFHPLESKGASCIECHMPVTTFMVVDPRHDHSFRIPRPDLSVELKTPNTCNQCHTDKSANWAATQVNKWYGKAPQGFQDYAQLLHAARQGDPAVRDELAQFVQNDFQAAIARASVVTHLPRYLSRPTVEAITAMTRDDDPLLRRAAVEALSQIEPAARVRWLGPMLTDSVKDVRITAARALADVDVQHIPPDVQISLQLALDEYIATQTLNADRPEAQVNLGLLHIALRDPVNAEAAYRAALQLEPAFTPAIVNLADLYRASERDVEAEKLLREAVANYPDEPALLHSLGLALVRQQNVSDGIKLLKRATVLAPDDHRYAYVYAVALHSTGQVTQAIAELEKLLQRQPFDRDSLWAIYSFYKEQGDNNKAQSYLQRLQQLEPDNPQLQ